MPNFFVPFNKNRPAPLVVNGHKIVLLSADQESLNEELGLFSKDGEGIGEIQIKKIKIGESLVEQNMALGKLAKAVQGEVVLIPSDVGVRDVVRSLEYKLPWIH